MDQVVAQHHQQAAADRPGQGDQGPHGQAAEGLLEAEGRAAGAVAFGAADRDDAAGHLELLRGIVAKGPGHGQGDQHQVMEVPAGALAAPLEAASGLLPDLGGEKLPQAEGHRSLALAHTGVLVLQVSRAISRSC